MTPSIRVATFDVYGTLIDWEGGAASFLYELASRHEPAPPPARELRERWEALQFERLQGDWRHYSEVLSDSLAEWVAERGYRWNEHDGDDLVRSMKSWQPFPDTIPSLREAKEAGIELWLISNTDRAIIEHTLRHLEVPFDGVVVAEDCRAYKPSHKPFEHALRQIDASPDEILHVAFGYKYDIGPAKQLGLRTAWVNRHGEQEPGQEGPDHEWPDLRPLASVND